MSLIILIQKMLNAKTNIAVDKNTIMKQRLYLRNTANPPQ